MYAHHHMCVSTQWNSYIQVHMPGAVCPTPILVSDCWYAVGGVVVLVVVVAEDVREQSTNNRFGRAHLEQARCTPR